MCLIMYWFHDFIIIMAAVIVNSIDFFVEQTDVHFYFYPQKLPSIGVMIIMEKVVQWATYQATQYMYVIFEHALWILLLFNKRNVPYSFLVYCVSFILPTLDQN